MELLGSAPYNMWVSTTKVVFSAASNLSENSSAWLPLPVVAVAVAVGLWASFSTPTRPSVPGIEPASTTDAAHPVRWTIVAVSCVVVALLIWSFFELPAAIGRITGMSYVPGTRTPLALGFASILLVVLCGTALRGRDVPRAWWAAIVVGVGLTGWFAYATGTELPIVEPTPSFVGPVLGAMVVGLGFIALVVQKRFVWAAAIAAAYCLVSFALINPLYQGIAPLGSTPATGAALWNQALTEGSKVAVVGGALTDQIEVRGSEAELISGMTMYPDRALMEKLAPTQEADWNNFQHYLWKEDLSIGSVRIDRFQMDASVLRFNPCSPDVKAIGINWFTSRSPMMAQCLREVGTTGSGRSERFWYQYR